MNPPAVVTGAACACVRPAAITITAPPIQAFIIIFISISVTVYGPAETSVTPPWGFMGRGASGIVSAMIEASALSKTFVVHRKDPGLWGSVRSLFRREKVTKVAVKEATFRVDEGEIDAERRLLHRDLR